MAMVAGNISPALATVSMMLLSSENVRPSAQGKCPLVWC